MSKGYQPYNMRAVPTWVKGHNAINRELPDTIRYDSQLEARAAELFLREHIIFTPHVQYQLYDRSTPPKPFTYVCDFVFKKQLKPIGAYRPIGGVEIKGRLKAHDFLRADALAYFHSIHILIVGEDLLTMWIEQGMWPEKK